MAGLLQYLTVAGTIHLDADEVSMPNISIDAQGRGIRIDGKGEFRSVSNVETLQVDLKGSVQGLDKLRDWVGQPLPSTETITVSAELRGDERQKLNLGNIQVKLTDPAVSAALSGEIRNLGKSPKLILNFDVEVRDARPFLTHYPDLPMDWLEPLVTELLPAKGWGKLRSAEMQNGRTVHSIEKLEILSGAGLKSRVTGRVDHLFTRQWDGSVSARVYGELEEGVLPSVHADLVEWGGYLDSAAEVSLSGQGIAVDRVHARLISGYSETSVSGKIESLSPFETTGLELTIDRPHLDNLLVEGVWPALVRDIPAQGKLVFKNAGQPGQVSLDLNMADSDLSGHLYLPPANDEKSESGNAETSITGRFTSQNMDLVQLLLPPEDSHGFPSPGPHPVTLAG